MSLFLRRGAGISPLFADIGLNTVDCGRPALSIASVADDILDELVTARGRASGHSSRARASETDDALNFDVEVPGVPPENIAVTVDNGLLKISGKQQLTGSASDHHHSDGHGDATGSVSGSRSFSYQYRLPKNAVDDTNIKAFLENGLLRVSVPKAAPPQPRAITVAVHSGPTNANRNHNHDSESDQRDAAGDPSAA